MQGETREIPLNVGASLPGIFLPMPVLDGMC